MIVVKTLQVSVRNVLHKSINEFVPEKQVTRTSCNNILCQYEFIVTVIDELDTNKRLKKRSSRSQKFLCLC